MSCTCSSYGTYIGNINCPSVPVSNLGIPCPTSDSTCSPIDASIITYSGPQLNCTGILTGTTLDLILAQLDTQLCNTIGNIASYNTACLAPITTLQQFIETISAYVCTTQTQLTTFTGTTFPAFQASNTAIINSIINPGITSCVAAGIVSGDSLSSIITKLSNRVCDIYSQINISTANWSQCFTVSPAPTTVLQGFNVVLNQICQLNSLISTGGGGGGTLPTFNTTTSCLSSPSPVDTLVSVVNKLIVRTCQTPTFDINALSWNCVSKPSTVTTDLQSAFGGVLGTLDFIKQNFPSQYSSDFIITNVDNTQPCLGKKISLAVPSVQDRFVAINNVDTAPGTLATKLTPGTGVSLDVTTVPGTMIINATGSATGDHKVSVNSTDPSPDYLINKVESGVETSGITVVPSLDLSTNTVQFNTNVDLTALFNALLTQLTPGSALAAAFCSAIASCPSPCASPSNVVVTYNSGTTTTTTSSTTTTTTTV